MFVSTKKIRRSVVSTKKFRQNACRRSAVSTKCRVDEKFSTIICRPNACRQKFVDQQHIYPNFHYILILKLLFFSRKKPCHFNIQDYEKFGQYICESLRQYLDVLSDSSYEE